MRRGKRFGYLLLLTLTLVLQACSLPTRYSCEKDLGARLKAVKKVGVVIPSVEIYQLGFRADTIYDGEKSRESRSHFEKVVLEEFAGKGFDAVLLPNADDLLAVIDFQRKVRSAYSPPPTLTTLKGASQAEMDLVMKKYGVELLAIVEARDHVASAGRRAVLILGGLGGMYGGEGISYTYLTLVDQTGSSVFFDRRSDSGTNLTWYSDVRKAVRSMVENVVEAAQLQQ